MYELTSLTEFNQFFADDLNKDKGFVSCYAIDDPIIEDYLKPLKVTARCIALDQPQIAGMCIFTGKPAHKKIIFAKAY